MNVRLHSKWNANYDEISRLYASGKTIQDACIKAKIHPPTYYKICKALNKESIAKEIITIQKGGTVNTINEGEAIKTINEGEAIKTINEGEAIKTINEGEAIKTINKSEAMKMMKSNIYEIHDNLSKKPRKQK